MIRLFQIGDVGLHLHGQNWSGWETTGSGKVTSAMRSPEMFLANRQYLPENRTITITADIYTDRGKTRQVDGGRTPRQIIERLRRLVDFPTTFIGYELNQSDDSLQCGCRADGHCPMTWLSTPAVLHSVEQQTDSRVRLTLFIGSYWTPLNRYLWQWQDGDFNSLYPPPTSTPYTNFVRTFPDCGVLTHYEGNTHWSRRANINRLVAYDPELWPLLMADTGLDLPIGIASNWGGLSHRVIVDPGEWSAPPLSVYAFKNLPRSGTLKIIVHKDRNGTAIIQETSVNLATFNADLLAAGQAAIGLTDILYVGDVYPKPGFLVRAGVALNVIPKVIYAGMFPGQAEPATNLVYLSTPNLVQCAYQHTFRKQ